MNDYLWDRKGDAEEDVARLETLLGALAHRPRPLELPAEAAPSESQPAKLLPFVSRLRASRLFAPALAAAAVLLVAAVLVASLSLRMAKDQRTAPREVELGMLTPPPPESGVKGLDKVESGAVGNLPNVTRQRKPVQLAVAPSRRPRVLTAKPLTGVADTGLTVEAMRAGGASSFVESTRLLTKEQLVYALRFTGAKLKDVREKAVDSRQ